MSGIAGFVDGAYPDGGFDHAASETVPDPLVGLISDPERERIFLLRGAPPEADVDLASTDVWTDGAPFPSALSEPYNFQIKLPTPDLLGAAVARGSNISLSNPDGALDDIVDYTWLGADVPLYMGPTAPLHDIPFSLFTKILAGVAEDIDYDTNGIQVTVKDLTYPLTVRLEPRRYFGTGPCLHFDGTGDYVDFGNILNHTTGSFARGISFKSSTAATGTFRVLYDKKGGGTAANAGLWFYFDTSGNLVTQIADGSTQVGKTTTATSYHDGDWHRIDIVVDRSAQVFRVYIDGALVDTSASIAAVGSVTTTTTMRIGSDHGGTATMIGDCDEARAWTGVPSTLDLAADWSREIPSDTTGLEGYWKFNEATGATAADSTTGGNDGTITGATWRGSLEGDSSLAGIPKPRAYGRRRQIRARLVDAQFLVYQINNGSVDGIDSVKDKGDPLTFGSDLSDIYSAAPSASHYNTCLAKGLFRLGSSPVGEITCDFTGDDSGSLGYASTATSIARKLLQERGGLSDSQLDLASFTELESLTSRECGFYWDQDINIDKAVTEVMTSSLGWWGPTRTGKIQVGRIDDPSALTPEVEWTIEDDLVTGGFRSRQLRTVVKEVRFGYRPYQTTLSPDQVAGSVSESQRDDFGKDYRYTTAKPDTFADLPDDANSITINTSLDLETDAYAEAKRLAEWLATAPRLYELSLKSGSLAYYIGTVARLSGNRYNLEAGKNLIVVGVIENMGTSKKADSLNVLCVG